MSAKSLVEFLKSIKSRCLVSQAERGAFVPEKNSTKPSNCLSVDNSWQGLEHFLDKYPQVLPLSGGTMGALTGQVPRFLKSAEVVKGKLHKLNMPLA